MFGPGAAAREVSLFDELRSLLGDRGLLVGPDVPEASRSDESGVGRELPKALLRPADLDEIAGALAICRRHGQTVVPQGGMTGLAGGANPGRDDVALSLARFAGVEEIDTEARCMVVRAGTVLATAQAAAEAAGLFLPIDFGARGSAQIGGLVATNAGGLRVVRHGTTRANVLGLEAVLADGTVLSHLSRMTKDNTGFDLRQLMIGSEGTLGVVTRVVLRLTTPPAATHTVLCALPDPAAAPALLHAAQDRLVLSAFEAMWPDYFAFNAELEGHRFFDAPPAMVVLIEAETDPMSFVEEAFENGLLTDALPARSLADARAFWDVREGHRMTTALPGLLNFDVGIPVGRMADFVATTTAALEQRFPGIRVFFFGHLGDGNLHAVVHLAEIDDAVTHEIDAVVYAEVAAFGGSISAEHGIGTLKRDWLGHSRSPAEIRAMRAIKAALDPHRLLNPGKLVPDADGPEAP